MSISKDAPRGIHRWVKDPFSSLSHAVGALLAVVVLVLMLVLADGGTRSIVALSIYGASLILLFAASAIAHCVRCGRKTGERLDRLDYAAIFLLIAGTYTPICLTVLRGAWGWSLFGVVWGLAMLGIIGVGLTKRIPRWTMFLYLPMGWMVVVAAVPLVQRMPGGALLLLVIGGLIYTAGSVVFLTGRPRLFPGRFGSHDLWHVMVLLGSGCHVGTMFLSAV